MMRRTAAAVAVLVSLAVAVIVDEAAVRVIDSRMSRTACLPTTRHRVNCVAALAAGLVQTAPSRFDAQRELAHWSAPEPARSEALNADLFPRDELFLNQ